MCIFSSRLETTTDQPKTSQGAVQLNLPLRAISGFNYSFSRIYHQLQLRNACPLPKKGPALLVCNHTSSLDPCLLQSTTRRPILWMMAREYFDQPRLRWLFRMLHCIPVDRNGRDTAATRAAIGALQQGNIVGLFPEGAIEVGDEIQPFFAGTALMALRGKCLVYPAYLDGSQRGRSMVGCYLKPNVSSVRFGKPIDVQAMQGHGASKMSVTEITEVIRESVIDLRQKDKMSTQLRNR